MRRIGGFPAQQIRRTSFSPRECSIGYVLKPKLHNVVQVLFCQCNSNRHGEAPMKKVPRIVSAGPWCVDHQGGA